LKDWLFRPEVFNDLREKYGESPLSLETIRYALIQDGFRPNSASSVAQAFVESLEYIAAEAGDLETESDSVKVESGISPMKEAGSTGNNGELMSTRGRGHV